MDNDDEGFDLIQPSLIQQLRSILDQYPDDGQILKVKWWWFLKFTCFSSTASDTLAYDRLSLEPIRAKYIWNWLGRIRGIRSCLLKVSIGFCQLTSDNKASLLKQQERNILYIIPWVTSSKKTVSQLVNPSWNSFRKIPILTKLRFYSDCMITVNCANCSLT